MKISISAFALAVAILLGLAASGSAHQEVVGNLKIGHPWVREAPTGASGTYASIIGGVNPFVLGSALRSRGFRPFYRVRLPAQTRREAETLCSRLEAAGGSCAVLRS